jgi:N-acetylglucosaminyl-diphospho-decaprenol L-rhamnosyltransferase
MTAGDEKVTQSAIIVVYKTPAELTALVASLRSQTAPPDEIIIIDNGASEGEPVPDLEELEKIRIERPERNIGFGAGCNLGIRLAGGEDLLLLNADVVPTLGCNEALCRRLHSNQRIGVVGPRIYSGGKLQASARTFPSLRTGLLGRRSLLTRLMLGSRRWPSELSHSRGGGGPVDWVSGACMMAKRSAIAEVGGFDEGYWMYWEDADLCRRLAEHDWAVHYEPDAILHHATGASGTNERTIRAFHESAALFAGRWIARTRLEKKLFQGALEIRCRLATRNFGRSQSQ